MSSRSSGGGCHHRLHLDRATHLAVTRGRAVASARSSPLEQEALQSQVVYPVPVVIAAAGALSKRSCQIYKPAES